MKKREKTNIHFFFVKKKKKSLTFTSLFSKKINYMQKQNAKNNNAHISVPPTTEREHGHRSAPPSPYGFLVDKCPNLECWSNKHLSPKGPVQDFGDGRQKIKNP